MSTAQSTSQAILTCTGDLITLSEAQVLRSLESSNLPASMIPARLHRMGMVETAWLAAGMVGPVLTAKGLEIARRLGAKQKASARYAA